MVEEPVPEVGQDPLADPARQVRLRRSSCPSSTGRRRRKAPTIHQSARQVVLADAVVERVLRRGTAARARWRSPGAARRPRGSSAPVGPREAGEPPSRRRVRSHDQSSTCAPRSRIRCAAGLPDPHDGRLQRVAGARLDRVGELALEQAVLVDVAVDGARLEQLLVRAAGRDPPVVEDDDLVGERDRREAVGDDQRRPVRASPRAGRRGSAPRSRRRPRRSRRRGSGCAGRPRARGRSRAAGAGRPRA